MKRKSNASICFSDFFNVLWWGKKCFLIFINPCAILSLCYLLCVELYGIHYVVYSMFSKGGRNVFVGV